MGSKYMYIARSYILKYVTLSFVMKLLLVIYHLVDYMTLFNHKLIIQLKSTGTEYYQFGCSEQVTDNITANEQ